MMKIKQAFSEDIIFERTDFSSCDIVITDYPLFDLPKEIDRIYILEEELTREDWELIFSKISIAILICNIKTNIKRQPVSPAIMKTSDLQTTSASFSLTENSL